MSDDVNQDLEEFGQQTSVILNTLENNVDSFRQNSFSGERRSAFVSRISSAVDNIKDWEVGFLDENPDKTLEIFIPGKSGLLTNVFAQEIGERIQLARPDLADRWRINFLDSQDNKGLLSKKLPQKLATIKNDPSKIVFILDDYSGMGVKVGAMIDPRSGFLYRHFDKEHLYMGVVASSERVQESYGSLNLIVGTTDKETNTAIREMSRIVSEYSNLVLSGSLTQTQLASDYNRYVRIIDRLRRGDPSRLEAYLSALKHRSFSKVASLLNELSSELKTRRR